MADNSYTWAPTTIPADRIGARSPSQPPATVVRPGTMPGVETGAADTNVNFVGSMLVTMSVEHGQRQEWHAISFRLLFHAWVHADMHKFPPQPLPTRIPQSTVELMLIADKVGEGTVRRLTGALNALVGGGYVEVVKYRGQDFLVPTDTLLKTIR